MVYSVPGNSPHMTFLVAFLPALVNPITDLFNEGFRRNPWAALMKRLVDLVLALGIFLVTWPFMLLNDAR